MENQRFREINRRGARREVGPEVLCDSKTRGERISDPHALIRTAGAREWAAQNHHVNAKRDRENLEKNPERLREGAASPRRRERRKRGERDQDRRGNRSENCRRPEISTSPDRPENGERRNPNQGEDRPCRIKTLQEDEINERRKSTQMPRGRRHSPLSARRQANLTCAAYAGGNGDWKSTRRRLGSPY